MTRAPVRWGSAVCRHLAYLGAPVPLAALMIDAPHGLVHQSYAPADMRGSGTVNADGFGAVWYPPGAATPVHYRSDRPIWSDASFAAVARATRSGAVLAAVRSATVGMPVTAQATPPFVTERWAFSHNGVIPGWPESVSGLATRLPVADLLTLDAPTDSALLWALVRDRLRGGQDPAAALAGVVAEVAAAAPGARLNLVVTDGTGVWATAWGHALAVRVEPDAVLVASEPIDGDPSWRPVPDRHLVTARPGSVRVAELAADPPRPVAAAGGGTREAGEP